LRTEHQEARGISRLARDVSYSGREFGGFVLQNAGRLTPCKNELIDSGLQKRAVVQANNGHGCLSGEVEQTAGIPKWSLDAGALRRNLELGP